MKQDEIIQMARPAEWLGNVEGWTFNTYQQLEDFAKLVAAKEREACVKRAEIALLGTLKTTSDRVLKAIRNTSQS